MRRIGVLLSGRDDPEHRPSSAFLQGCEQLGWTDGRNLRIDTRWGAGNTDNFANTQRNWSRSRPTLS